MDLDDVIDHSLDRFAAGKVNLPVSGDRSQAAQHGEEFCTLIVQGLRSGQDEDCALGRAGNIFRQQPAKTAHAAGNQVHTPITPAMRRTGIWKLVPDTDMASPVDITDMAGAGGSGLGRQQRRNLCRTASILNLNDLGSDPRIFLGGCLKHSTETAKEIALTACRHDKLDQDRLMARRSHFLAQELQKLPGSVPVPAGNPVACGFQSVSFGILNLGNRDTTANDNAPPVKWLALGFGGSPVEAEQHPVPVTT